MPNKLKQLLSAKKSPQQPSPQRTTPMVDGIPTAELYEANKKNLDVMLQCCEAEILAHQQTGQPPEPHFFCEAAIRAGLSDDYELQSTICEAYYEMFNKSEKFIDECKKLNIPCYSLPHADFYHKSISKVLIPKEQRIREIEERKAFRETHGVNIATPVLGGTIKTFKTKVVGVSQKGRQAKLRKIARLELKDETVNLELEREPNNKHDPNAIKVTLQGEEKNFHIGYISAQVASTLASQVDAGYNVFISDYEILSKDGIYDKDDLTPDVTLGLLIEICIDRRS